MGGPLGLLGREPDRLRLAVQDQQGGVGSREGGHGGECQLADDVGIERGGQLHVPPEACREVTHRGCDPRGGVRPGPDGHGHREDGEDGEEHRQGNFGHA